MSRDIVVPVSALQQWVDDIEGLACVVPVKVDWPELRLTDEQMLQNACDLANGWPPRHPDLSIINLWLPRIMREDS